MNWYKKAQKELRGPFLPDEEELTFLTGRNPNEPESKLKTTYQPEKKYTDPRDAYRLTNRPDMYDLTIMDLNSEIASIEETINSFKEELKKPSLSTRSKRLPVQILDKRKEIKLQLNNEINRLKKHRSELVRQKRFKSIDPEKLLSLKNRGPFRNPGNKYELV